MSGMDILIAGTYGIAAGYALLALAVGLDVWGRGRRYRSGMRWAFWRWTMETPERPQIRRLHLLKAPWCSLYLHWKLAPDPAPDPHDHPVPFVAFVLRGGYMERRYAIHTSGVPFAQTRPIRIRWYNRLKLGHFHRIEEATPRTLTLVLAGRPRTDRPWGFATPRGFIPWKMYHFCATCGKRDRKPIFCLCDFEDA